MAIRVALVPLGVFIAFVKCFQNAILLSKVTQAGAS